MYQLTFCVPLAYQPAYEAIAKEIRLLLPDDGSSTVISIPPFRSRPWAVDSRPRVRTVHPLLLLLPQTAKRALRGGRLLHVFTPLPLPRRIALVLRNSPVPIVVTIIAHGGLGQRDRELLGAVRAVVAECGRDRDRLLAAGLPAERLHLIPAASDVGGQVLPAPADGPLTILFASSPLQAAEARQRGVDLIAEAARQLPDVRFRLLWRPGAEGALATVSDLSNLLVDRTLYRDITEVLATAHAVVAPFRPGGKAKSVPLSVVEAIRCARPVLVSTAVGMADQVAARGCGVVFEPVAGGLAEAIGTLQAGYARYQQAAAQAVDDYGPEAFRRAYARLYG